MSMPADPVNIAPSGVAVAVWMGSKGTSVLIVNPDTIHTIYIGYQPTIAIGATNTIPLGPGQSVVMDGSRTIYVIGAEGTAATIIIPGGTSFFQPTTLANIGGIACFVQNTQPIGSSFPVNSIWFNESTQSLYTWNGSTWAQQQFNADELITAGTIVASLIAAGTIVAGIVNGTTITGATIVADGTSGQILVYTGTPALGNLLASVSGTSGTDAYGNTYQAGVTIYSGTAYAELHVNASVDAPALDMPTGAGSEAEHGSFYTNVGNPNAVNEEINTWLVGPGSTFDNKQAAVALTSSAKNGSTGAAGELIFFTPTETVIALWNALGLTVNVGLYFAEQATAPSAVSGEAITYADSVGSQRVIDGSDLQTYSTERTTQVTTSNTTVNSTTPIAITGLSFTVSARKYKVRGRLACQAGSSGTVQPFTMRVNGTAVMTSLNLEVNTHVESQGGSVNYGTINALNADPSVIIGTLANSTVFDVDFEGVIVVSAGGTFIPYGRCTTSSSDEAFTVGVNSWMELLPV